MAVKCPGNDRQTETAGLRLACRLTDRSLKFDPPGPGRMRDVLGRLQIALHHPRERRMKFAGNPPQAGTAAPHSSTTSSVLRNCRLASLAYQALKYSSPAWWASSVNACRASLIQTRS